MATHTGNEGIIKSGANAIAEVTAWSLEEAAELIPDTAIGDAYDTHLVGTKSWSGSLNCHWDESDSTGQETLKAGLQVTVDLFPEGDASADIHFSGTATIDSVTRSGELNGVVEFSVNFTGTGALTEAAVV